MTQENSPAPKPAQDVPTLANMQQEEHAATVELLDPPGSGQEPIAGMTTIGAGGPDTNGDGPLLPPLSAPSVPPKSAARPSVMLLLAAVCGGVFGFGAAAGLHFGLPVTPVADPDTAAKFAAMDMRFSQTAPLPMLLATDLRQNDLEARLTAAEKAGAGATTRAQLASAGVGQEAGHIRALQAAVDTLQADLAAQRTAVAALPAAAPDQSVPAAILPAPPVDLAPLEARLVHLEAGLAAATAAAAAETARLQADRLALAKVEAAREEAAAALVAQQEIAKTQARIAVTGESGVQRDAGNAAALLVVAQALLQALERPTGYATELAAAANLGAGSSQIADLQPFARTGLPRLRDLAAAVMAQGQPSPEPPTPPPASQGLMDQLLATSAQLVRVTPPLPAVSTGAAAMAEALSGGDISGALALRQKMPDSFQQATAALAETARTRLAAQSAAQALFNTALAAFAEQKS